MEFTTESIQGILADQGTDENAKTEALLKLYQENVNKLVMNRDDILKEKRELNEQFQKLSEENKKGAEARALLQKQLEANSPEEIKRAYEIKSKELEQSLQGAISERDLKINQLEKDLEASLQNGKFLRCSIEFDNAASKYDIESSSRNNLREMVIGFSGEKFTERDLGSGKQLLDKDGRTIESALKNFFDTDFGKKFLRNGNSGGGATGSVRMATLANNPFVTDDIGAQMRLYDEDPKLYEAMKAAANK